MRHTHDLDRPSPKSLINIRELFWNIWPCSIAEMLPCITTPTCKTVTFGMLHDKDCAQLAGLTNAEAS